MDDRDLLHDAYRDFNGRRLDALLARLHPEVAWANGMEGGRLKGVDAVRAYWNHQWATIDPNVEPLLIELDTKGRFVVKVHQTVRDLDGKLLLDTIVHHAYLIRNNLIERMDIE